MTKLSDEYVERLTRNAVRCLGCDTVIESTYPHDYCTCPCGSVSVDGGLSYQKVAWRGPSDFEPLYDYEMVSLERLAEEDLAEEIVYECYGGKERHMKAVEQYYVAMLDNS